jgi:very-short-patch-repair endonuclease
MLYKNFETTRKAYLFKHKKISEYDSENLMYTVIEDVLMADEFSKLSVVAHQPLNSIIRNPHKLNDEEVNYAMNSWTHIDFLIYNFIDKSPVLAVEVDGYEFHKTDTVQHNRDKLKDQILQKYQIPIIRFKTNESMEKQKLQDKLKELLFT